MAQTLSTAPSPPPRSAPLLVAVRTNAVSMPLPAPGVVQSSKFKVQGSRFAVPNFLPSSVFHPQLWPSSPPRPQPGIYETAPYTSIVVVPGPHPDDRMIVGLGGGQSSMPVAQPELRLIPRSSAQK